MANSDGRCDAPPEVTLRYEMAFTLADFQRLLPGVAAVEYDASLNQFTHVENDRCWTVRLADPRQRAIGRIRLPVVDVVLSFKGYTPAEVDRVMARFFAHFRRGGG
ncbi:MAG TPA: hypothetical protein VMB73_06065 [Acetobacteraceae bacterium]|nr:hypothetical protein [Acetobacteraceae bacterium]